MESFTSDLMAWFDKVLDLIMGKLDEENDNVLLYEIEQIIKDYTYEYTEILSENIQDIYINTSHTVEAKINNEVVTKSLENIIILQSSKDGLDYQSLIDDWLKDKETIEKTIQKN